MDYSPDANSGATDVLQEALGVTPAGKCIRHPNCPVLSMAQNKVVSCRICFTEEKSIGIRQRKNFAAVVNQLQTKMSLLDEEDSDGFGKKDKRWADDDERRKAHQASMQSVLLYQSKQAQTLDSIMKRITQVQNWMLRQKEKEVLSLQLQIQGLEERLDDTETTVVEQTQTIRALRRTIQQDLKIIKTMATAKDNESNQNSKDFSSCTHDEGKGSSSVLTMSPLSISSASPNKAKNANGSPHKFQNNRLQKQMDQLKRLNKTTEDEDEASVMMGMKKYQSTRTLENTIPIPGSVGSGSELMGSVHTPCDDKAAGYWNDQCATASTDPTKLFKSFRGGLLDIPRSPPPARHDNESKPTRQKLTLASFEKDALKLPSMRNMGQQPSMRNLGSSRNLTQQRNAGIIPPKAPLPASGPLGMLTSMALSPNSDVSGHSRTTPVDSSQKKTIPKKAIPSLDLLGPAINDEEEDSITPKPRATNSEESKGDEEEKPEKFCFNVTGAECQDKYGEGGKYTGSLHALENLPYGTGQMNYDSGRIYSGDWVSGSWHGKGVLLNPNGDRYEGDFMLDTRHGQGIYYWHSGDVYTGSFFQDKRHGQGKFSFHNGNEYEGDFNDGVFEGFGRYKFNGGYYEGEWKGGKYNGQGELKLAGGGTYKGEFKDSLAHGFGTEVMPNGKKRRGIWEKGQPADQIECV